jgi:hypothetical protein
MSLADSALGGAAGGSDALMSREGVEAADAGFAEEDGVASRRRGWLDYVSAGEVFEDARERAGWPGERETVEEELNAFFSAAPHDLIVLHGMPF